MAKIGRNDPCSCGSGKKFKKCHGVEALSERREESAAARAHAIDGRMTRKLSTYANARFGREWDPEEHFVAAGGDLRNLQLLVPFSHYVDAVQGRSVVDWFLAERAGSVAIEEREWLEAQHKAWLSIWEVHDVTRGEGFGMTDMLSGAERRVLERGGSESLHQRDMVLARVVDFRGTSVVCGIHERPLPPGLGAAVVDSVRSILKVRGKIPTTELRSAAVAAILIVSWQAALKAIENRPAPRLQNTDGEDLLFTTDHFEIRSGEDAEVMARVGAMSGAEREDGADEPVARFKFLRDGNRMHATWNNTVVGSAEISPGKLKLETNSAKRADELRRAIEGALGPLVTFRVREHQDPEAMLRDAPKSPPVPRVLSPDEIAALREIKALHYRAWLDQPLPALNGQTPREAAGTRAGMKRLLGLVKEIENHESHLPAEQRIDITSLVRELDSGPK
jgi:hypothetical protein